MYEKKIFLLTLVGALCVAPQTMFATETEQVKAVEVRHYSLQEDGGEFKPDEKGNYHYVKDNQIVKNAFFTDGTYTYYLQNDGTPMKDRLTYHPDGKHVIYFDEEGHEAFDQFAHITKSIEGDAVDDDCYFGTYGYMYVDEMAFIGDTPHYYNAYGVEENNGWFTFADGNLGYAYPGGQLAHNTFGYNSCGQKVYFNWNGTVAKGLISDGTYYYQMDETNGHLIGAFQVDANAKPAVEPAAGASIPLANYDLYILGDNHITKNYPNNNFLTCVKNQADKKADTQLLIYRTADGGVSNSETHNGELFITNRGITIGSSKQDVIKAYGNPGGPTQPEISGKCANGKLENVNNAISPVFKELKENDPGVAECFNRAVAYGEYGPGSHYDELMKDDVFSYIYFVHSGIRFYYDENDTVIMIQYYSERTANSLQQ